MAKTAEKSCSDVGRKETKLAAKGHFSWMVFSSGTPSGDQTLGSYVPRFHEKQLKDASDDEIKLAGLDALVPEELEEQ